MYYNHYYINCSVIVIIFISAYILMYTYHHICRGLSSDHLRVPSLMVNRATNSVVEYHVRRNDGITGAPLIAGYEVTRFGVTMIGQYVNTGRGSRVTISPAVPGAQYRITAWALGGGRRSATPAVVDVTTGEAGGCDCMAAALMSILCPSG